MSAAASWLHQARAVLKRAIRGRLLLAAAYLASLISGIGMIVYSPLMIHHAAGGPLTDAIGVALTVSSAICLVSLVPRWDLWRWERVGLVLLGWAVTMYAAIAWILTVSDWPGRVVEAALTTALFLLLGRHLAALNRLDDDSRAAAAIVEQEHPDADR